MIETTIIECPFCAELGTHKGTCKLSMMNTGKRFIVAAIYDSSGNELYKTLLPRINNE